jgi:hypothetical protein
MTRLIALFALTLHSPALAKTQAPRVSLGSLEAVGLHAKMHPQFADELARSIKAIVPGPECARQYRAEAAVRLLNEKWSAKPESPAPQELLDAETARLVAAIVAQPRFIDNHEGALDAVEPADVAALRAAARSVRAQARSKPEVRRLLGQIRKGLNLGDGRAVTAFNSRLSQIFDNMGERADRPEVLAGRKLPALSVFAGERVTKFRVISGVIHLETKYRLVKTGIKYDPSRDIAEVAALIRQDIRRAVDLGDLPRLDYSVRIRRYAGGASIYIAAKNSDHIAKVNASIKDRLTLIAGRFVHEEDFKGPGDALPQYPYVFVSVESADGR